MSAVADDGEGLDSIAAPFVVNSFHDEAAAFMSFSEFVSALLPSFFRNDNPTAIQVCMMVMRLAHHSWRLRGGVRCTWL